MTNKKLTKEQAAIIGAYTGINCGSFSDIHKLAEELLKRPIFTHEFASKVFNDELKEKVKPMFLELCRDGEANPVDNIKIQPKPVVDNKIETNNEVERALEEWKKHLKAWKELAQGKNINNQDLRLDTGEVYETLELAQNLVKALESERNERAVISKPEPKIDMKKEHVEPVSIWKDVSELNNRNNFDNQDLILKMEDGKFILGQGYNKDIRPVGTNNFMYHQLKSCITLTDFINSFEQMQKDIEELKKCR